MIVLPLLSLLLATTGFAIPHHHGRGHGGGPVPGTVLQSELPSNQTVIVAPNTAANYVAVGVGNQNYTCTSAGTYSSKGAVAMLFDITTLYGTSKFSTIQECVHDAWVNNPSTNPLDPEWDKQVHTQFKLDPLGIHTFVKFNNASDPKFDFTQSTNNPSNFVIAIKAGDIAAPSNPGTNVDWLHLTNVDGGLASDAYRVLTVGGKPPSECTGTGTITVKYAAQYWFFNSN